MNLHPFLRRFCVVISALLLEACSSMVAYKIEMPTVTQINPDPAIFAVALPLKFATKDRNEIVVPPGFITDLASIPRALWWWQAPHEGTLAPAILHDYLYWDQSCSREEADAVIYMAMLDTGMSRASALAVYQGVNDFGGLAWSKNEAARRRGETRFFTESYLSDLRGRWFTPNKTWAQLQKEAEKAKGLRYPPKDSASRRACASALREFKALRDL